jgi:N-formylglutamate amidohydrolase
VNDPQPAFTVKPGDPASPGVLHVPHAGRRIPPWVRQQIVLDDSALEIELGHMTDAGTDVLAERVVGSAHRRPWLVLNHLSRLVVDPERFPDDREVMRRVGMGAVYTRTAHGQVLRSDDSDHKRLLIRRVYEPYAAAVADVVQGRLSACGAAVVIDVHSYPSAPLPYELYPDARRPAVCLGVDEVHTPRWLLDSAYEAFAAQGDVVENEPFRGTYVPLRHYGTDLRVSSLMVEMRRDDDGRLPAGLVAAVTALVDVVTPAGR